MKVRITQEDIDKAKAAKLQHNRRGSSCPIAQALLRRGYIQPKVGWEAWSFFDPETKERPHYKIPVETREFIERADTIQVDGQKHLGRLEPTTVVL